MPENFPYKLSLGYFAPNLLPYHFDKQDAKDKWGGENVFSPRPSLRRTAERVYGLSCMSPYDDEDVQAKGELLKKEVMTHINSQLGGDQNLAGSKPEIFEDVGGKEDWVALMNLLKKKL